MKKQVEQTIYLYKQVYVIGTLRNERHFVFGNRIQNEDIVYTIYKYIELQGDILNMFAVMTPELQRMFRKFNPTERMLIDRATGLLNTYFAVSKGQLIDLYHFATL